MTEEQKNKLTQEQIDAIVSRKSTVVVSASAGSGKTTTMVRRVIELIKEQGVKRNEDDKPLKTREIAMMTFTEASAREMLAKLGKGLQDEIKRAFGVEREALVTALDELPFLSCGTIHSFCLRLIKSHFEFLSLSPAMTVADEDGADYLKKQAFKNVLKKRYEEDKDAFLSFTRRFEENKDDDLEECVCKLYEMMASCEVREGFFDDAKALARSPLENSPYAERYLAYFKRRAEASLAELERFREEASAANADKYVEKTDFYVGRIKNDFLTCLSLRDVFLTAGRKPSSSTPQISAEAKAAFPVLEAHGAIVFKTFTDLWDDIRDLIKTYSSFEKACQDFEDSAETIEEFIDFTAAFAKEYAAIKENEKVLDYGDLEKYALELLANEEVRAALGFRYVLVDECQDVNPVQDKIIRLISEKGALFTVGDVKQSIYRFRLADPELFNDRMKNAGESEDSQVILFDQNFRSSPAVINFVNEVFSKIMTEKFGGVDYKKHILKGRAPLTEKKEGVVEVFFVPDKEKETVELEGVYSVRDAVETEIEEEEDCPEGRWVLKKIREVVGSTLYDAREKKDFKVSYGDLAILAAKRSGAIKTIRYLQKKGVPLNLGDFMKEEASVEQEQLVDLFRLLLSPADDFALLSVLRSPIFCLTSEELAEIGREEGRTFYEKACAFAEKAEGIKIKEAFAFIKNTRFISSVLPLDELAIKIVREKFERPLLKESDGRVRLGKLLAFARSIKGRKEASSLAEFISYYDENEELSFGGDVQDKNAISVMTVHSSKGLEFPVVFLVGTGSSVNPASETLPVLVDRELGVAKNVTDDESFEKKSNFAVECVKKKKRAECREDALRLLYVALTRAKNSLYVSGALSEKRFTFPPHPEFCQTFAEWIAYAVKGVFPIDRSLVEEEPAAPFEAFPEEAPSADQSEAEVAISTSDASEKIKASADEVVRGFGFSYPYRESVRKGIKYTVTGINSSGEERHKIPSLFPEDKTQKGVAFHAVMENIPLNLESADEVESKLSEFVEQKLLTEEEKAEISPELVLDAAKKISELTNGMKIEREKSFVMLLPAECVLPRSKEKRAMIENERDEAAEGFDRKTQAERISALLEGKPIEGSGDLISVQGKLDLVAFSEGLVKIVDYKLTTAPTEILKKRYRAQLDLYALAVRKAYGEVKIEKYIFVLGRNETIAL